MHAEHAALLADLRRAARPIRAEAPPQNDSHGGSGRPCPEAGREVAQ
jgi:hypothetical protein